MGQGCSTLPTGHYQNKTLKLKPTSDTADMAENDIVPESKGLQL